LNVTSSAIPNEMLLRLYDYHGLRHAIYKQGGCVRALSPMVLDLVCGGAGAVVSQCRLCPVYIYTYTCPLAFYLNVQF
jgi:hypothetical protein